MLLNERKGSYSTCVGCQYCRSEFALPLEALGAANPP